MPFSSAHLFTTLLISTFVKIVVAIFTLREPPFCSQAATFNAPESALDELEAKWGGKYPLVIKSWRGKWPTLSAYFKYPDYVRTAIYTTNAVEAVHRQFRKLTKTKDGFANENILLKLLYAGILKTQSGGRTLCKTGTWPCHNWRYILTGDWRSTSPCEFN